MKTYLIELIRIASGKGSDSDKKNNKKTKKKQQKKTIKQKNIKQKNVHWYR